MRFTSGRQNRCSSRPFVSRLHTQRMVPHRDVLPRNAVSCDPAKTRSLRGSPLACISCSPCHAKSSRPSAGLPGVVCEIT
jgi:hypothetical protein